MLTHVFISAHSLTCCAWSGSPQLHSEEGSSSSKHCAWKSVITELGWPPCRRHGHGFRRATCGPLFRVAGNASSLESLPFVRLCSARLPAIVHSSALVRRVSASPPGCTPAEALLRLSAAVAAAYGRVPRGQWALLDADMFELIDRSACLVEPVVVVTRARASLHLARPAPRPVAAREHLHCEALRKVSCSPRCSSRDAPVALCRKEATTRVVS